MVKRTPALTTYGKMKYTYMEIQTNEWDSVPTHSCLPTTYRQPKDHLRTTYQPQTDHLPTKHLPTTYPPLTDHLPTTYQPPTDHLPNTFLRYSLFTITHVVQVAPVYITYFGQSGFHTKSASIVSHLAYSSSRINNKCWSIDRKRFSALVSCTVLVII